MQAIINFFKTSLNCSVNNVPEPPSQALPPKVAAKPRVANNSIPQPLDQASTTNVSFKDLQTMSPLSLREYQTALAFSLFHAFHVDHTKTHEQQVQACVFIKNFICSNGSQALSFLPIINDIKCTIDTKGIINISEEFNNLLPGRNINHIPQRFDKTVTGLNHTLVRIANTGELVELCKSFNPTSSKEQALLDASIYAQGFAKISDQTLANTTPKRSLVLGTGSFGSVYLGRDISSQRLKAIKVIREPNQERRISNNEYQTSLDLKHYLNNKPNTLKYFATSDHLVHAVGSKGLLKSYLIQPLILEPNNDKYIKHLHTLPGQSREFRALLHRLVSNFLKMAALLEKNNMCHPDLKPANTIDNTLIDLSGIWLNGQGSLGVTTKSYFAPETDMAFQINGKYFFDHTEFMGIGRFLCGACLFETVTGNLPCDYPLESVLSLPENPLTYQYTQGFKETKAVVKDPLTDKTYSLYEQTIIKIAKKMMHHDISKRLSPSSAIQQISTAQDLAAVRESR